LTSGARLASSFAKECERCWLLEYCKCATSLASTSSCQLVWLPAPPPPRPAAHPLPPSPYMLQLAVAGCGYILFTSLIRNLRQSMLSGCPLWIYLNTAPHCTWKLQIKLAWLFVAMGLSASLHYNCTNQVCGCPLNAYPGQSNTAKRSPAIARFNTHVNRCPVSKPRSMQT
jgi:hypothetical protein